MATEATVEATVAEELTLEQLVENLNISDEETQKLQKRLAVLDEERQEILSELEKLHTESGSRKEDALRKAKQLKNAKFGPGAIIAALKAEFDVKEPRISHKLTNVEQANILDFITSTENGVSINDVWDNFKEIDKQGISTLIRNLVAKNQIKKVGTTRSMKYLAV